jgi:hypothetical protein
MIYDIQNQGEASVAERVLAVVAGQRERAKEVVACFQRQGERVNSVWYPSARELVATEQRPRFEAVILFASQDDADADVDEAALRGAMRGTPFYRL